MLYQCRFINQNKYTPLVEVVDNRGEYTCMRIESIWEILFSIYFCNEPKTALKNGLNFFKQQNKKGLIAQIKKKVEIFQIHQYKLPKLSK